MHRSLFVTDKRYTRLYWLAVLLLAGGIALITVDTHKQHTERKQAAQLKKELLQVHAAAADSPAAVSSLTTPIPAGDPAPSERAVSSEAAQPERWERLRTINQEVVGWLHVDGTEVDYPILQHADNDYYLNVDAAGRQSMYGSIFMDYRSDFERSQQNIVIYGHNMLDGSMFGSLQRYKSRAFFNEHRVITLETPSQQTEWEIFSVYTINAQKDRVDVAYANEQGLLQAALSYREKSLFPAPPFPHNPDRLLTLVTCSNETDDTRLVLHAFPKEEPSHALARQSS
ncbi:class B sortase [Paenibacillus whitsoniae]|uniref:class B sortase n=1 Tax=Paenibacillus whitsoniae TaxID=2496558 RepID=UPI0013DE980F|nr:class B sortase [Paenibacillus whitsoniae]